jgi:nucleotide-binding universal stress UspA family protein
VGDRDLSGPVVFGYDGSHGARDALSTLGRLRPSRPVIVVNDWDWPGAEGTNATALLAGLTKDREEIIERLDHRAKERSRDVAEEGCRIAEDHGLAAEPETIEATDGTWRGIASIANDRNAAMIAVGSRGPRPPCVVAARLRLDCACAQPRTADDGDQTLTAARSAAAGHRS